MPKKLTYEYVKKYIEKDNKCFLLSTEYIDSTNPLKLKCACGNIFTSSFNKLKKSQMLCQECRKKISSEKNRMSLECVIRYIEENNCKYISGEYQNNLSKLTLQCSCGSYFIKDFNHFKRGQTTCEKCSINKIKKSKIKYTKEVAIKILKNKNLILLSDYIDSTHDIYCKCEKNHFFHTKLVYLLYNKIGCLECSKEYHVGEKANHYKGGESEVLDTLRKSLKQWKITVAKKYNYCCAISQTRKDCVVHHLVPFIKIVKESCEELGLPLYKKIKEYTDTQFEKLEKLVLEKHTLDVGILLQRKIHFKFHSIYGMENTTKEQFEEFKNNLISDRIKYPLTTD